MDLANTWDAVVNKCAWQIKVLDVSITIIFVAATQMFCRKLQQK